MCQAPYNGEAEVGEAQMTNACSLPARSLQFNDVSMKGRAVTWDLGPQGTQSIFTLSLAACHWHDSGVLWEWGKEARHQLTPAILGNREP